MNRPRPCALVLAVSLLALAAGCNKKAEAPSDVAAQAPEAEAAPDKDFVEQVNRVELFELAAAQVAQTRSRNAGVKAFAGKMLDEHKQGSDALRAAIAASGQKLSPPTVMHPDEQGKLDALNQVGAEDFDEAYLDGQISIHQELAGLLRGYADGGAKGALKDFAAAAAGTEEAHLQAATALEAGRK